MKILGENGKNSKYELYKFSFYGRKIYTENVQVLCINVNKEGNKLFVCLKKYNCLLCT